MPQRAESVANQRFTLAVQARRRFIENEDSWIGEHGARDGDALALTARQLHAALADDRVVALLESIDELVAVRDLRRGANLFLASRPGC